MILSFKICTINNILQDFTVILHYYLSGKYTVPAQFKWTAEKPAIFN